MNRLDFNGRTAVVTGGAAGIGFAIAQRLAQSGARVALWDRDDGALDRHHGGRLADVRAGGQHRVEVVREGVEPSKHFGEVWYFVPGTDEIHVCGLTPSAMMRKAIREQGGPR